jgi:hypothetical protein
VGRGVRGNKVRGGGKLSDGLYTRNKVWATHFIGVPSESTLERSLAQHQRVVVLTYDQDCLVDACSACQAQPVPQRAEED